MNASPIPVIAALFGGFILLELLLGRFRQPTAQRRDALIEIVGTTCLLAITIPAVTFMSMWVMGALLPEARGSLASIPWVAGFALFLVFDDMMQYWWHRLSHSVPLLYRFHRAHHSAPYMSVRIVYRNNSFYYLFMPGLWLSGVLIYLGLAHVYFAYAILKLLVIIAAHSSLPWDAKLYEIRALRPLMWLLERTISTPATHSAHHGLHGDDGVTHYKGNYGNLLFVWDVLFGTAKITRRRPATYGIENMAPIGWGEEVFWPLVPGSAAGAQGELSAASVNASPK